jgi:uncharacterized protein DUF4402
MRRQGAAKIPLPAQSQIGHSFTMSYRPLFPLFFALASATSLAGQGKPIQVQGTRGLTFGAVLPGVPRAISRTDPANSGQFDIVGQKNAGIQLTFTLPSVMTGPAGATMPLLFGGSDAGYSPPSAIGSQVAFDPRQPFATALDNNGRVSVYIGATAQPAPTQQAGSYTATLTLNVAYFP